MGRLLFLVRQHALVRPARERLAVVGADRDLGAGVRHVHDPVAHEDLHRVLVFPLAQVPALAVEALDPFVLPVADQNLVVLVDPDVVRQRELAGPVAFRPPGPDEVAVFAVAVDVLIAVAVGDVHLAVRRDERLGRPVVRHAPVARLRVGAPALEQLAVERPPGDGVCLGVGDVQLIPRAAPDAVRRDEAAAAVPAVEQLAVLVEDQDARLRRALEDVDPVLRIPGHALRHAQIGHAAGPAAPLRVHFVGVLAGPDDLLDRHLAPPAWLRPAARLFETHRTLPGAEAARRGHYPTASRGRWPVVALADPERAERTEVRRSPGVFGGSQASALPAKLRVGCSS